MTTKGFYRVWGGMLPTREGQRRCIVATKTKKRAAELMRCSLYYFNYYISETGNDREIAIATGVPETVLVQTERHKKLFKVMEW